MLGADTLRLVRALPRLVPVARLAVSFISSVDTVLKAVANTSLEGRVSRSVALSCTRARDLCTGVAAVKFTELPNVFGGRLDSLRAEYGPVSTRDGWLLAWSIREGKPVVMHDRDVIIGSVNLGEFEFLEVNATTNVPARAAARGLNVVPFDADVLVTVSPLMFVMEAERMKDLVRGHSDALAGDIEVERLSARDATHVAVAATGLHHVQVIAVLPWVSSDELDTGHFSLDKRECVFDDFSTPVVESWLESIGHLELAVFFVDVLVPEVDDAWDAGYASAFFCHPPR